MKASLYFVYPVRSLARGGQRSLLAIFCVAIGVMALVSLQLVGQMLTRAFTSNIREANGGDIAVTSQTVPLTSRDLPFFDQLQKTGAIVSYTPIITTTASPGLAVSSAQTFTLQAVDPQHFPVVAPPAFKQPVGGLLTNLLSHDQVVVDQNLLDQLGKRLGDQLVIHIDTSIGSGFSLSVKIVGLVENSGIFAQSSDFLLLSLADYQAAAGQLPLLYTGVDIVTANHTRSLQAAQTLSAHFPAASVMTVDQALHKNQDQVDLVKQFLDIAGLLALLIGGIGIINTMQVLLSRRKMEIAMLKSMGYPRAALYLLFGIEAALLGLAGGVLGAALSLGVSAGVRAIVQQAFPITIAFFLDPQILAGGLLIGLATALIFGLLPIAQAAALRPLNVLREVSAERGRSGVLTTWLLLFLLSMLFCLLAAAILGNLILSVIVVYSTALFLALLSLFFRLVVQVLGVLPVPEKFSLRFSGLLLVSAVLPALVFPVFPAIALLLWLVVLAGCAVVFLPRTWKTNTRLALRNLGRQRVRSTTTLLALFIGVFTIGLLLVLGQDLRDKVDAAITSNLTFNFVAIVRGNEASALQSSLNTIPGVAPGQTQQRPYVAAFPVLIDGVPFSSLVKNDSGGPGDLGGALTAYYLGGIEGYDVTHGQVPDLQGMSIVGHNLSAGDGGTNTVLLNAALINNAPLRGHIHLGSRVVLASKDGHSTQTVIVVGFYQPSASSQHYGAILSSVNTVASLTPVGQATTLFYLKIDPSQTGKALRVIGMIAPSASIFNFASISDFINRFIGDVLLVLTTIASLSLLAGVLIIANAVALAMLERRRELGILKALGYTGRMILASVLIENGVVGGTGALLAMLLVTLATDLLGHFFFKSDFGVSSVIALGLVSGIALLAMAVAALVASNAVRIRPLEVLRYE